jgi:hypothetical protein
LVRSSVCLALAVFCSASLFAQQVPDAPPQAQTPADNGSIPATLIQPIERAADYLNFYAFVNGILDTSTALPGATTTTSGNDTGAALEGGGGISANHDFATGTFALSYRGDYRSYADPEYPSGTDQSLTFIFRKLLTRHLTFSIQENAGIYPQGTTLLQSTATTETGALQTTPFSLSTKFTGTSTSISYQQSKRLSYEFTGTFYLTRYNSAVNYGNDDISGSGSVLYRLTRSTTVSGTYQESRFLYQQNAGNANSQMVYATLSHNLIRHWTVGASGGATYTSDSGTVLLPVTLEIGQTLVPVYVQGHYMQKSILPYLQGSVTHNWHHTVLSLNGGEGVTPGNGVFLASRNIGVNGLFSYTWPRSNISAGGYYSRLTSVANASSLKVTTTDVQVSYAYNLIRHLGSNIRYDHINYGVIGGFDGHSDNRLTFGFYFTSKDIPLALF